MGPKISGATQAADALPNAYRPDVAAITDRMEREVLAPLENDPAKEAAAKVAKKFIDGYKETLESEASQAARKEATEAAASSRVSRGLPVSEEFEGGARTTTMTDLHDKRVSLGKSIFGLKGDMTVSTAQKEAMYDLQHILSDEIEKGMEKSGANVGEWKELNHQYWLASTIGRIAEKGVAGAGLSGVPLTAAMSALTGLIHGGPLGAAVMGGGVMLAKKYGPQVLAAGARGLRNFIDEGAAEGLANKTAELISSERAAAATAEEGAGAAGLANAWERAAQKLEPVAAPAKDAARDVLQEKAAHKMESEASSAPETVAALSQLAAANKRVEQRVTSFAKSIVTGKKIAKAEVAAHSAVTAEKMVEQMERVHQLATNPDMAQQHIGHQTADVAQHAPSTAQAMSTAGARAISYLHAQFPAPQKAGPLAPATKPNQQDVWRYNITTEVLHQPSSILKHAMDGTVLPIHVAALQNVFPERLAQIQSALTAELAAAKEPIPYARRMGISQILGTSVDGTSTPAAVMANQAIYKMPSAKPMDSQTGGGAVKPSQAGLGKLKSSERAMLPGQSASHRAGGG